MGNGGTSDTGETFDKLLGPENRNLILKLIKVNSLQIQCSKSKQSFYKYYYFLQKKTPTQRERIRKMMQFMYVSAAVINSGQEIFVDDFENYLKTGMINR